MDSQRQGSSSCLIKNKEGLDLDQDYTSDSDDYKLPLSMRPPTHRIRNFLWYRLNVIIFGLVTIAFLATWMAMIALTWKIVLGDSLGSYPHITSFSSISSVPTFDRKHGTQDTNEDGRTLQLSSSLSPSDHTNHDSNAGSARLHVPGFRLAYNSSYCNGIEDPEGARARGCIFDPIQTGWMPGPCVDMELTNEFIASHEWKWFNDEALTKPNTQEAVLRGYGGADAYTIDDYHFRHCEYTLKQLIKNHVTQAPAVGFKGFHKEHLEHCVDRLINYNTPEIRNAWTEHVVWAGSGGCYERIVPSAS
ncbi:hypothetical protein PSV08DRAFT_357838 [Bipolaris maydis]|nr:hypothetical protein J3E73DRAFT_385688 [Bipolaris maydis]KAJ5029809.1 hypothetical protein J3E73DRAFT_379662 [Bipolaris maydis]KAJ6275577.1 hypothetical protein PSV08DRAFT_357838 [Bipolaris maydis]KAJ6286737.1 hypothetical protein J3E71DRAFT_348512 [Bipolaris maydis]